MQKESERSNWQMSILSILINCTLHSHGFAYPWEIRVQFPLHYMQSILSGILILAISGHPEAITGAFLKLPTDGKLPAAAPNLNDSIGSVTPYPLIQYVFSRHVTPANKKNLLSLGTLHLLQDREAKFQIYFQNIQSHH